MTRLSLTLDRPIRTHYRPWQPCWISHQRQKQKSCIWPSNEHFWQVWFKSVSFANRKFKMATMTRLSLTLDPMGISHFHLFFWNHKQIWTKLGRNVHWMVIYKICVFGEGPFKVCFKLTYWFQRRRLLNIFSMGSYVKIKSSHGGHLEFPISKRFTNLVQDHPMIIPAKPQFISKHIFNIGPYGKNV
jgi:hypothetical protein